MKIEVGDMVRAVMNCEGIFEDNTYEVLLVHINRKKWNTFPSYVLADADGDIYEVTNDSVLEVVEDDDEPSWMTMSDEEIAFNEQCEREHEEEMQHISVDYRF